MKKENKNLFFASQIVTLAQKTMKINREKRIQMLFHNPLYLHVPTPKSFEVFAKLWQLRLVPVNYPSTSNDDENLEIPARQRGQNATRQTRVTTKWDHGAIWRKFNCDPCHGDQRADFPRKRRQAGKRDGAVGGPHGYVRGYLEMDFASSTASTAI